MKPNIQDWWWWSGSNSFKRCETWRWNNFCVSQELRCCCSNYVGGYYIQISLWIINNLIFSILLYTKSLTCFWTCNIETSGSNALWLSTVVIFAAWRRMFPSVTVLRVEIWTVTVLRSVVLWVCHYPAVVSSDICLPQPLWMTLPSLKCELNTFSFLFSFSFYILFSLLFIILCFPFVGEGLLCVFCHVRWGTLRLKNRKRPFFKGIPLILSLRMFLLYIWMCKWFLESVQ